MWTRQRISEELDKRIVEHDVKVPQAATHSVLAVRRICEEFLFDVITHQKFGRNRQDPVFDGVQVGEIRGYLKDAEVLIALGVHFGSFKADHPEDEKSQGTFKNCVVDKDALSRLSRWALKFSWKLQPDNSSTSSVKSS